MTLVVFFRSKRRRCGFSVVRQAHRHRKKRHKKRRSFPEEMCQTWRRSSHQVSGRLHRFCCCFFCCGVQLASRTRSYIISYSVSVNACRSRFSLAALLCFHSLLPSNLVSAVVAFSDAFVCAFVIASPRKYLLSAQQRYCALAWSGFNFIQALNLLSRLQRKCLV